MGKNSLQQLKTKTALSNDRDAGSQSLFSKFHFRHCSYIEVRDTIMSLKNKPGLDPYDMNAELIKNVRELILIPLTNIINICVEEGVFPDVLGLSRVIPIPKAGYEGGPDGLRPIAILPVIAKVFESLLKKQIITHFEKYKLFNASQFGFRPGKSTTLALIHLINKVIEGKENSQMVGALFCDLTKAFDCVPPTLLLDKLRYYNFSDNSLQLIKSYFNNRKQFVTFNGKNSSPGAVICGVPQGSVMGRCCF